MLLPMLLLLAPLPQPPSPRAPLPAHVLNLSKIRRNVETSAMRVPDYACLETIVRHGRQSPQQALRHLDTLQLEVGIINNKEVYSWPGAETFGDVRPGDLVSFGAVSTGEFMQLLRAVFIGNMSVITWHGEETLNGRRALRYNWVLPLLGFRSQVNLSGISGDVSLKGSFWADAGTLELLRLESQADEIPPMLPLARMATRIDYGKMPIHGRTVWFPQSAESHLLQTSGQETLNQIEFSHCRQYSGASTISFDDPAPTAAAAPPKPLERIDLPPGVTLNLRLDTEIDSARANVGDPITAQLTADAVLKKQVLIPAGALVKGRIRRLERSTELTPHYVVGLEFSVIESPTQRARFYGLLETVQPVTGLTTLLAKSGASSTHYSGTSSMQGFRLETGTTETLAFRDLPGVGTFFMSGQSFRLAPGLRMTWKTVQLPQSRK